MHLISTPTGTLYRIASTAPARSGQISKPGQCGWGVVDVDSDGDGTADCNDAEPEDPDVACWLLEGYASGPVNASLHLVIAVDTRVPT